MMDKFATAINCIDGRTQACVSCYIKDRFDVEYVDMVTMPGVVKVLADNQDKCVDLIKRHVKVSVNKHQSKVVAVVGHYDCAANPVCKDIQLKDLAQAIKTVEAWGLNIKVVGLWVDENWNVCRIP